MEGISDIKISGFDERRPPRIRKEPYIDLYFKLNHKAPADWCSSFNDITSKGKLRVKIKPSEGLYIESWVRSSDEVEGMLDRLKKAVTLCSEQYVARVDAAAKAAAMRSSDGGEEGGEQGRLDRIVAALKFD